MKKIIPLLALFIVLIQSCDQMPQKPGTGNQPKDETDYLIKVSAFKNNVQAAGNPFIKDSIIKRFNKYANDSIRQVKDWIMVVDGINESYILGPKMYILTLKAEVNRNTSGRDLDVNYENGIQSVETFDDAFPEKSKLKEVSDLLNSIKNLVHGDTVVVSGHPSCLKDKNGNDDYSSITNMAPGDLIFDLTSIKKK